MDDEMNRLTANLLNIQHKSVLTYLSLYRSLCTNQLPCFSPLKTPHKHRINLTIEYIRLYFYVTVKLLIFYEQLHK